MFLVVELAADSIGKGFISHMRIGTTDTVMHERRFHSIEHLQSENEEELFWKTQIEHFAQACNTDPYSPKGISKVHQWIQSASVLVNMALAEFATVNNLECRARKSGNPRFSAPLRETLDRYNINVLSTFLDHTTFTDFEPKTAIIVIPEKKQPEQPASQDTSKKKKKKLKFGDLLGELIVHDMFTKYIEQDWNFYHVFHEAKHSQKKINLAARRNGIVLTSTATAATKEKALEYAYKILETKLIKQKPKP